MFSSHRDSSVQNTTYHFFVKKGTSPLTPIQQLDRPEDACDYVGEYELVGEYARKEKHEKKDGLDKAEGDEVVLLL
jgi:hypothetical protein